MKKSFMTGLLGIFIITGGFVAPSLSFAANFSNVSENWAGYVASGGAFTGVTGTWVIPHASLGSGNVNADAAWVGIGGVTAQDLIQAGTQEIVSANGPTTYQAWIETLPSVESIVPLTVTAGDSMTVSIVETSNAIWQVSLVDNTTGAQYETSVNYQSSLSSAEWIEEMPTGNNNAFIPLDNFGTVSFSNAFATENGNRISLALSNAQTITMTDANGDVLATPSSVGADGASFSVSRSSLAASTYPQTSSVSPRTWRRTGVGIEGYVPPQRPARFQSQFSSSSSSLSVPQASRLPFQRFRFRVFRNEHQMTAQF